MRRWACVWSAAAILAAVPGAARVAVAQTIARPMAPIGEGNAPPGWVVTPRLGAAGGWDSNVTLAGREANVQPDFVTAVSTGLDLGYRGRRTTTNLSYAGAYDFHQDLKVYDAANHRGRLEFNHQATRNLSFSARDYLSISPTTDTVDAVGLVLQRRTTQVNNLRATMEYLAGVRTKLTTGYTSQWVTFAQDETVDALYRGGHSHGADIALDRKIGSRTTLGLGYDIQYAFVANGTEQFDIQRAETRLEFVLGPYVTFQGAGGYAWLTPGRDGARRNGPTVRAGLVSLQGKVDWELRYGRTFVPSLGFGGTTQNEEVVGALRMPMGRRFGLSGSLSLRRNDSLEGTDAELRTLSAQGLFYTRIARYLRLEVFAIQALQNSGLAGGQIDRTQAGIRISTFYPVRMR